MQVRLTEGTHSEVLTLFSVDFPNPSALAGEYAGYLSAELAPISPLNDLWASESQASTIHQPWVGRKDLWDGLDTYWAEHGTIPRWQTGQSSDTSPTPDFAFNILSSIEVAPVESGYTHPGEELLSTAISRFGSVALDWLRSAILNPKASSLGVDLLRCLGRLGLIADAKWRIALLEGALTSSNVELRHAAIQAAEEWQGDELISLLREHRQPEPWMDEYRLQVIRDRTEG